MIAALPKPRFSMFARYRDPQTGEIVALPPEPMAADTEAGATAGAQIRATQLEKDGKSEIIIRVEGSPLEPGRPIIEIRRPREVDQRVE